MKPQNEKPTEAKKENKPTEAKPVEEKKPAEAKKEELTEKLKEMQVSFGFINLYFSLFIK